MKTLKFAVKLFLAISIGSAIGQLIYHFIIK